MNNVKNLDIKHENIKKGNHTLKKIAITGLTIATIAGTIFGANKIYKNVEIPEGFNFSGSYIETGKSCDFNKKLDEDFVIVEVNDWKNGIDEDSVNNIDNCNLLGIPCGISIKTSSKTKLEAQADAMCVIALLERKRVDAKIFYNLDEISHYLTQSQLVEVCKSFLDMFNNSNYQIAFSGTEETLKKIENDFANIDKMVIVEGKKVEFDGNYSMCNFTRTNEYLSNVKYDVELEPMNPISYNSDAVSISAQEYEIAENHLPKGIDVSEFQGKIDWDAVKEEGVEYAFIRFSEFPDFHSTGQLVIDSNFYENINACERLNIPYGIYCFTQAETEAEAINEANTLLEVLKENEITPSLPIYYDIEMQKHAEEPGQSANLCLAFKNTIEENGYTSAVYCSYSLMKQMYAANHDISDPNNWIAFYKYNENRSFSDVTEEHIPSMSEIGEYGIVQVTSNANINGIKENTVDTSFMMTDTIKDMEQSTLKS